MNGGEGGQNLSFSVTSNLLKKAGSFTWQIDLLGQPISNVKFWNPNMTKEAESTLFCNF